VTDLLPAVELVYSLVADDAVENLAQVKKGDLVTATYTGAFAYEVKKGGTRTIKVLHPEKLQGVSVGDTADLTYTEAIAMKGEKATKK
jgi:hypothetical protein